MGIDSQPPRRVARRNAKSELRFQPKPRRRRGPPPRDKCGARRKAGATPWHVEHAPSRCRYALSSEWLWLRSGSTRSMRDRGAEPCVIVQSTGVRTYCHRCCGILHLFELGEALKELQRRGGAEILDRFTSRFPVIVVLHGRLVRAFHDREA